MKRGAAMPNPLGYLPPTSAKDLAKVRYHLPPSPSLDPDESRSSPRQVKSLRYKLVVRPI